MMNSQLPSFWAFNFIPVFFFFQFGLFVHAVCQIDARTIASLYLGHHTVITRLSDGGATY